jgi:hypothetical protein
MDVCMCMYLCIYIYIYVERERQKQKSIVRSDTGLKYGIGFHLCLRLTDPVDVLGNVDPVAYVR